MSRAQQRSYKTYNRSLHDSVRYKINTKTLKTFLSNAIKYHKKLLLLSDVNIPLFQLESSVERLGRNKRRLVVTDISEQPISPTVNGQAVQDPSRGDQ